MNSFSAVTGAPITRGTGAIAGSLSRTFPLPSITTWPSTWSSPSTSTAAFRTTTRGGARRRKAVPSGTGIGARSREATASGRSPIPMTRISSTARLRVVTSRAPVERRASRRTFSPRRWWGIPSTVSTGTLPFTCRPPRRASCTWARSSCSAPPIGARAGRRFLPTSPPTIRTSSARTSPAVSPATIPPPRTTPPSSRSASRRRIRK